MGLLNSLFGKTESPKKEEKILPWKALNTVSQLDEIATNSKNKPQLIFKHSTTCGISRMVMKMFTQAFDFSDEQLDLYYLDLHSFREVSNETAAKFQVMHQSPQLLIIKDGVVVSHASHGAISDMDINQFL